MPNSSSGGNQFITIGICTRNSQTTIASALTSIIKLNYPCEKLLVVIIDGLSKDETLSITKAILSKSALRWCLFSDDGRGLGYARQLLTQKSEGEFIAFVDADQALDPDWLSVSIDFLTAHPDAAGVRGRQGLTMGLPLAAALENYVKCIEDAHLGDEITVETFGLGGSLFRRQAIVDAGGFDPSFRLCAEDTDLAAKLFRRGWKIFNLKTAFFYHSPRSSWRLLYRQYNYWGRNLAAIQGRHGEVLGDLTLKFLNESLMLFVLSFKYTLTACAATKDVRSVLLPIHIIFKRVAYGTGLILGSHNGGGGKAPNSAVV